MNPSCSGGGAFSFLPFTAFLLVEAGFETSPEGGVGPLNEAGEGLYRKTHEVSTAFWAVSNATWPYFYLYDE